MNNNVESELISSLCQNKDIATLLQEDIDILFRSHKDIWQGVKDYYQKYKAVPDVQILEDRYSNFEPCTVSGPTQFYLDKLKEDYIANNLRSILLNAGMALKNDSATRVLEQMQKSIADISKLSNVCQDKDITDYEDAIEEYNNVRQLASATGIVGIKTNIKAIDIVYPSGMAPGHLIYIIGRTSQGKSWFAMYLAVQAWLQGFHPMIVSAEMSINDVRNRIYGLLGSGLFSVSGLERGEFDEESMRDWGKRILDAGPPFTIIANENLGTITPNIISAKIDQYKPNIVIADYAQLFTDNSKTKQVTERFTNMTNEFKSLAMNSNIPIVVLSAVTADENMAEDTCPPLSSVAWAKAIAYSCDISLSICRHKDTDIMEVYLEKNRRGMSAQFYLKLDLDRGKMEEFYEEI